MTGRNAASRRTPCALLDRLGLACLLLFTALTDALPPRLRFGHWQTVLRLLAPREMPASLPKRPTEPPAPGGARRPGTVGAPGARCLIVAGPMDVGGVESVVSMLALGLPLHGIDVEVVTTRAGRSAEELKASGVTVTPCSVAGLRALVADRQPDVIQLHRPDPGLVRQLIGTGVPTVPVFHAMESYLDRRAWQRLAELVRPGYPCVAVSEGVSEFFASRLGEVDIRVVVNGVPGTLGDDAPARSDARRLLGEATGKGLIDEDVLVVGLQRFSDQKNAAGLVDAFVLAADSDPRLRLVLAGAPENWLEFRRADAIRRLSEHRSRIHLLGDSDAATVLRAGDVYALDSLAEGGPLSAVEAVVHGLPVVLSDVGFSRQLVASPQVRGEVVPRANRDYTQRAMAAQRRRWHQSNRVAFAAALSRVAGSARTRGSELPRDFTVDAMLAGHAAVLHRASRGAH